MTDAVMARLTVFFPPQLVADIDDEIDRLNASRPHSPKISRSDLIREWCVAGGREALERIVASRDASKVETHTPPRAA